ncbi:(2Fe-2S)-binding protein [Chelativorans sp. AA-79]|uniref:(2Fe-2S)-binding protein n=1 Tax=Chelativorans sp. AA-79 TaxID=3028735 RepID=UPI0023F9D4CB|nr:(2Fe-2S)-binding protein [Chelativorans sp. AA-79]WEX09699.1 (2Fe-2S)-binding protein [Chelativorans sp. AA-79]
MVMLRVNGGTFETETDPDTPLLYVLRNEMDLYGAKFGCGLGQCGSCTVLADGTPIFSCLTPISMLAEREITTLEGLGTIDNPGPVQRAFIEEQAAQCGYCIPGMIMRAHALLSHNATPDETAIRSALSPSLCRCGTHMRILRAVRRAAESFETQASVAEEETQ